MKHFPDLPKGQLERYRILQEKWEKFMISEVNRLQKHAVHASSESYSPLKVATDR
jgi:hypothetical protein